MAGYTATQLYDALRGAGFERSVSELLATWALWRQDDAEEPYGPFLDAPPEDPALTGLDADDLDDQARAAYVVSDAGTDLHRWTVPAGDDEWDAHAATLAAVAAVEEPAIEVDVDPDPDVAASVATPTIGDPPDLGPAAGGTTDTDADTDTEPAPDEAEDPPPPAPDPPAPDPPAPDPPAADAPPPPPPPPAPSPSAPEPPAVVDEPPDLPAVASDGGDGPDVTRQFLDLMLAQTGDEYVFGAETSPSDADPDAFDCSEIIQWAGARLGIEIPDGTWNQYLWLKNQGMLVPVEDAIDTPGALLFRFSSEPTPGGGRPSSAHVAVSLGDGETIEARGRAYGVGSWEASEARFGYAAVIPQLSDGSAALLPGDDLDTLLPPEPDGGGYEDAEQQDSDLDGLLDALEQDMGLDPLLVDTDGDDLSDGYELLTSFTDPTSADTDGDGVEDALEMALGLDALDPDSDHDGVLDGTTLDGLEVVDTDGDRIEDALESLLGTDPTRLDSDGDGLADGIEYLSDHDPLDPMVPSTGLSLDEPDLPDDVVDDLDVDDLETTE